MNQIIRGFLSDHVVEYKIEKYQEKDAFEHFINRCIVTKYTTERFDPKDIMTGKGEIGIDGIAIVIDKQLITTLEDAEAMYEQEIPRDVNFIFIQAKRSEGFNGGEMSVFSKGVRHFFEPENERPKTNDGIENLIKIKDYIYSQSINSEKKPTLTLYFACCGNWSEDTNLSNTIDQDKRIFERTGEFENVRYHIVDQNGIITMFKELRRKISKTFNMEKHLSFTPMKGIKESYFGLVKCKDIAEIVSDQMGNLLGNIFEDNVRDFQGYNSVNNEIKNTVLSESQVRFAVLNNGITIIAKDVDVKGDTVRIFDYQIVNGCQSSHVLFDNRKHLKDDAYVLIKIIQVENDDVMDEIVYTSNRQTEVKYEAFTSASKFHKLLQDYYNSMRGEVQLYYERRSKQYDMDKTVDKNRVITLAAQTKDYVAMFLNEPHSTHRYYGEILSSYSKRLYGKDDPPEPYFASAYVYSLVDQIFKATTERRNLRCFRYHICYAIKVLVCEEYDFKEGVRKLKKMAEMIMAVAKSKDDFTRKFNTACSCIEEVLANETERPEALARRSDFTKKLEQRLYAYIGKVTERKHLKKGDIVSCNITAIKKDEMDVLVRTDDERKRGIIRITQVSGRRINKLSDEFTVGQEVQGKILSDYRENSGGWDIFTKRFVK